MVWHAVHLGFDLNSLCHKPASAAAVHPAGSTSAASLQPGEAGMGWPRAVAKRAAHRRWRHRDVQSACGWRGDAVRWAQGGWGGGCGASADVALGAAEGPRDKGHWL